MKKLGSMLSGAAIALALGYGATQAFASPAEQGDCRTAQERAECAIDCQSQGLVGYCYQDVGCVCEIAE
jgi:hypothetical protein